MIREPIECRAYQIIETRLISSVHGPGLDKEQILAVKRSCVVMYVCAYAYIECVLLVHRATPICM